MEVLKRLLLSSATLLIILYALTGIYWKRDVSTTYYALCLDSEYAVQDCPQGLTLFSATYKVFPDKQIVVSDIPLKFDNCAVLDAENWSCTDKSNTIFGMREGKYHNNNQLFFVKKGSYAFQVDGRFINPSVLQINRAIYYFLFVRNMFS